MDSKLSLRNPNILIDSNLLEGEERRNERIDVVVEEEAAEQKKFGHKI